MTTIAGAELAERIWARDATLWTGGDEARWLGWLDEPLRMQERLPELEEFAEAALNEFADCVVLGMGGSSLAPEVLRRSAGASHIRVLDTTHPDAIRRLERELDPEQTLFIVASKSGTTLETRCHLEYFWQRSGRRPGAFVAITDPGSELDALASERGFRRVFPGEPTIGGRYSALSVFGLVPGALAGLELARLLARAEEMVDACRRDGGPGLELGLELGRGWLDGRDKISISPNPGRFGLWAEQLLAESTGKNGKGLIPAPDESPDGPDRQRAEVLITEADDLGAEFYRWEFATAVAGAILGVNPFDQPNVQEAKERTSAILAAAGEIELEPEGSVDDLLAQAREGDYVAILAFIDPSREAELEPLVARARKTGCVVTTGLGPRYLHSTGQLHKGGPDTGLFIQVVDHPQDEVPIPGKPFGFHRLIRAQAAGDYQALSERGRRVVRVALERL